MNRIPPALEAECHPSEHWHVDLREPWEITFWTHELRCTEEQLREAVAAAGCLAGDVRAYLERVGPRRTYPTSV